MRQHQLGYQRLDRCCIAMLEAAAEVGHRSEDHVGSGRRPKRLSDIFAGGVDQSGGDDPDQLGMQPFVDRCDPAQQAVATAQDGAHLGQGAGLQGNALPVVPGEQCLHHGCAAL
jgi:hypothetical protein